MVRKPAKEGRKKGKRKKKHHGEEGIRLKDRRSTAFWALEEIFLDQPRALKLTI